MKIALVCKSDTVGGAAVVTFRLMQALRRAGHDARMIVADKHSDSPWVIQAASRLRTAIPFVEERAEIFAANGFDRSTLFQIDTASHGLPLHRNPFIREADVICLNWVNQGMLSLQGIRQLAALGKPLVWTMHDMWNMTGICHHAGLCRHFQLSDGECGDCRLLGRAAPCDLSYTTHRRKKQLYADTRIHFVAVSHWLAERARASSLMHDADISVIPNAFPISSLAAGNDTPTLADNKIRIIFGAARIDDPVKGHRTLVEATRILAEKFPEEAKRMELITFGSMKDPVALADVAIPHTHLGRLSPEDLKGVYQSGAVVVSSSEWETLPGTLVEGQAWGCVPVALDHGGQSDIIDHLHTGFLAPWSHDRKENAFRLAEGIVWASQNRDNISTEMRQSVTAKFSEEAVAERYLTLFNSLL